jgi:hypothetical protein
MRISIVVITGFVLSSILSVLTAQAVVFVQAQPITLATPFEQLGQQPHQPVTASIPSDQLAQQQSSQPQSEQQQQQATPAGKPDMVLISSRFNDNQLGGQKK